MAFLDFLRPKPAVKPLSFSEPIFIKENSSTKNQIEKLEKWKELIIPEQADRLTKDIKKLTSGLNHGPLLDITGHTITDLFCCNRHIVYPGYRKQKTNRRYRSDK